MKSVFVFLFLLASSCIAQSAPPPSILYHDFVCGTSVFCFTGDLITPPNQDSNAIQYQDSNAIQYQDSNAIQYQDPNADLYQDPNADLYQDNAIWYQDPNNVMYANSNCDPPSACTTIAQSEPLKCGKYQHILYQYPTCDDPPTYPSNYPIMYFPVHHNEHNDKSVCPPKIPYKCVDDVHNVTEKEWQDLMQSIKQIQSSMNALKLNPNPTPISKFDATEKQWHDLMQAVQGQPELDDSEPKSKPTPIPISDFTETKPDPSSILISNSIETKNDLLSIDSYAPINFISLSTTCDTRYMHKIGDKCEMDILFNPSAKNVICTTTTEDSNGVTKVACTWDASNKKLENK